MDHLGPKNHFTITISGITLYIWHYYIRHIFSDTKYDFGRDQKFASLYIRHFVIADFVISGCNCILFCKIILLVLGLRVICQGKYLYTHYTRSAPFTWQRKNVLLFHPMQSSWAICIVLSFLCQLLLVLFKKNCAHNVLTKCGSHLRQWFSIFIKFSWIFYSF